MENSIQENKHIDWENIPVGEDLLSIIPIESMERYGFAPFEIKDDYIRVAVIDENSLDTQNALNFFSRKNGKKLEINPISEEEFELLMKKFKNPAIEIGKALDVFEQTSEKEKEALQKVRTRKDDMSVLKDAPVAKMVEVIIKNAIDGGASDIHIEPMEDNVRVRYRVDGILYNSITLPKKVGPAVVSRVKILSNLKIDEKRMPQDGRFRIEDLGRTIDFRVSSFPVAHGEKIVMRILDTKAGLIELEELGTAGRDLEIIKRVMQEPYGIILVTGPTGSGKSTTLYSVLKMLNTEGVNIVTLEDPVEYVLPGISQSQVKPEIGYTFASGLRSILRQDPDIVMVGEIRDAETAELAIHAALTGHLVLSTLHTNSAIGAIPRLIDMGIQSFLIASSVKALMAQRLVRKICPDCKEEVKEIPSEVREMIQNEIRRVPSAELNRYGKVDPQNLKLYHGVGCTKCQRKGMKGRVAVFEVFDVNDRMIKLIDDKVSEGDIAHEAVRQGYTTMKQDGILKALAGITTIEEVARVTEDENEEEVIEAKGE